MKHRVSLEPLGKTDDETVWLARCLDGDGRTRGQVRGGPGANEPPKDKLAIMLADMDEICGGQHEVAT